VCVCVCVCVCVWVCVCVCVFAHYIRERSYNYKAATYLMSLDANDILGRLSWVLMQTITVCQQLSPVCIWNTTAVACGRRHTHLFVWMARHSRQPITGRLATHPSNTTVKMYLQYCRPAADKKGTITCRPGSSWFQQDQRHSRCQVLRTWYCCWCCGRWWRHWRRGRRYGNNGKHSNSQ